MTIFGCGGKFEVKVKVCDLFRDKKEEVRTELRSEQNAGVSRELGRKET
jgi:hypothetical protein